MTLRGKMQAVMTELNGEIAERDELIYAIALALLSESNLFILGDPGQAKSFAVNEFRKRITGRCSSSLPPQCRPYSRTRPTPPL